MTRESSSVATIAVTVRFGGKCGVRSAECGKCVVWKVRGVENKEYGKCEVWKMLSVENVEHFKFNMKLTNNIITLYSH